jgi:hypothetical protein
MFLSFNLHKLVSSPYLFTNAVIYTRSDKMFFAVGALAVILAIVFKIAALSSKSPVDKETRNKFYQLFLTIGISEVVWFGFRYENATFLGSHFVALVILLIGLVWLIWLLVSLMKNYKGDKITWEKEQLKLKYLPK